MAKDPDDEWINENPVNLAKQVIAYAMHGNEEQWEKGIQFSDPTALDPGVILSLYETGRPEEMRRKDAFILFTALRSRFEQVSEEKGYWNAELPPNVAMEMLRDIWKRHIEDEVERIDLEFWYTEMRLHLTAAMGLLAKGVFPDLTRSGVVAVDRLTKAGLDVTTTRVAIYTDLVAVMRRTAEHMSSSS